MKIMLGVGVFVFLAVFCIVMIVRGLLLENSEV